MATLNVHLQYAFTNTTCIHENEAMYRFAMNVTWSIRTPRTHPVRTSMLWGQDWLTNCLICFGTVCYSRYSVQCSCWNAFGHVFNSVTFSNTADAAIWIIFTWDVRIRWPILYRTNHWKSLEQIEGNMLVCLLYYGDIGG